MRPVRLTLQAFGPYPQRVVIDFREVIRAGLFGIYGQTGSGKSTIFSAMTFALFGEPARPEQDAPSLRSDLADPETSTEVEFVFDIGARRYVVLRRPDQTRPKARGEGETRSAHEAYLFDATGMAPEEISGTRRGRIVAERKVREVDTAITNMLGYGAEQFRQIVLLPQGRFERFLSARTRERLDILRDLFDVTRYQALMTELRLEADAAERQVREERAVCYRRLAEEGFDHLDALIAAIGTAEACFAKRLAEEEAARALASAADAGLKKAEILHQEFVAAEKARDLLAEMKTQREHIESLAERVRQAERAQSLLDLEERTREAGRDAGDAEAALREARAFSDRAREAAAGAGEALERAEERTAEVEALRRSKDELERFEHVLMAAEGAARALETALEAQRSAQDEFATARKSLDELRETRRNSSERLKAARIAQARRDEMTARRVDMVTAYKAALDYEKAWQEVGAARAELERQARLAEAAFLGAQEARAALESAESNLVASQALHLSMKLVAGSPCPVCGATDHPDPAAGEMNSEGLDGAFRLARQAWQAADLQSRQAAEKRAALQATLDDRGKRLAGLAQPAEAAVTIAGRIAGMEAALEALGKGTDIEKLETGVDDLDRRIDTLERECARLRDALEDRRNAATEARAARDGKLEEVPGELQEPRVLASVRARVARSLRDLIDARNAAEQAVRTSRETALGAAKDLENAVKFLADCRERQRKAVGAFQTRLAGAGLGEAEFQALKPAIATLEADRETVGEYRRRLLGAEDAVRTAAAKVEGVARPDLARLREAWEASAAASAQATEARIEARKRAGDLVRLRTGLEEIQRRLDDAEAASGPLRGLAALVNGQNSQRMTLETFAIGAMFDQVLEAANQRLGPMTSGRYSLERNPEGSGRGSRGLGIQVFDIHTGKARATSTLSGGETFIAALALALGLADIVESTSGKVRLDTIFIDEGFGSLDTENGSGTLDQVLQVLNGLVSQSRAIGLISHVPLVQEAIPNGFYVRKGLSGSSVEEKGLV